ITALSLDLVPRIARAQNMDVLSSMANIAGYKSVLLAANALPKFFPMLMTAAGTILPAKVFVLGAGVAGLQAIATARRLGAVVTGFDIRPVVKEQVESLGARFVAVGLEEHAEDAKGYAKEIVKHGVRILGPVNLVSAMAFQASQLYARNVLNFLLQVYDKQARKLALDSGDEVVKACLVARGGELLQTV